MATKKKIQDINVQHRNADIVLKFKEGFAPVWEAYVRWPGCKNKKYFTSVPAWNRLPSAVIDLVKERIDAELGLAYIEITEVNFGTHRYTIRNISNEGNYILREKSILNNWVRFNPKTGCLEVNDPSQDGKWDIYISKSDITQVSFWNKV